jgi:hypothetical protein
MTGTGFGAAIDAIGKYSWRSMVGVFLATGVILCFPGRLGISDWAQVYRAPLICGFVVSGGFLSTYVGSGIVRWVRPYVIDTRIMQLGRKHLAHLSPDEKAICRKFVEGNGNSLLHNPVDGAISTLVLKSILFSPGQPSSNGMLQYRMQWWALEYLREKPELFQ